MHSSNRILSRKIKLRCKQIMCIMLFWLFSISAGAQPSYTVRFHFKLYDPKGRVVDYKRFCREFKLVDGYSSENTTPCSNPYLTKKEFFREADSSFTYAGTIVYNDLSCHFVYNKDTMTIVLASAPGGSSSFAIDSIQFTKGDFYVKDHHLKYMDIQVAKCDYYNHLITYVNSFRDRYTDNPFYYQIQKLKKRYHFNLDDWNEKSPADFPKQ